MNSLSVLPDSLVFDPGYIRLKELLIESTGLAYYSDKDEDLAARICRRLSKLGLQDCGSYLDVLRDYEKGEPELDALILELTIGETYFFRYREQFDALRTIVLPDILARKHASRRLRIWSAGCSTGAEPYSVAILLRREFSDQIAGWDVNILGTDINRDFLAQAREGRFEEWAFRSTPDELRRCCFRQSGKSWILADEHKEGVAFQYHNLVKHHFPSLVNNLSAFDLILCRNAMIYFSRDIVARIVAQFHECLVDDGWLVVGHAEPNAEIFSSFRTVLVPSATLYQKACGPAAPVLPGTSVEQLLAAIRSHGEAAPAPPEPPRPPAPPANPDLSEVRLLADRGEWDRAAHCCRKLLERDALDTTAHFYHALILKQMGFHAEAERSLRRAIYLDRSFVLAHYYLGLTLQKKNDTRGSIRAFENVRVLLAPMDAAQTFPDAGGITVAELNELTGTHLEVLRSA